MSTDVIYALARAFSDDQVMRLRKSVQEYKVHHKMQNSQLYKALRTACERRESAGNKVAFNTKLVGGAQNDEVNNRLNELKTTNSSKRIVALWLDAMSHHHPEVIQKFYGKGMVPTELSALFPESQEFRQADPDDIVMDNSTIHATNTIVQEADDSASLPISNYSLPEQGYWDLIEGNLETINGVFCIVNMSLAQHSYTVGPVGLIADVEIRHLPTECGLKYGFKTIGIKVLVSDPDLMGFRYHQEWRTLTTISDDCTAILTRGGQDSTLLLNAQMGVLNNGYTLSQYELFSVTPAASFCEFSAELIVEKSGMHILNTDGSPLSDENKSIVLASLVAKNIAPENTEGWIPVAKKEFLLRPRKINEGPNA